MILDDLHKNYEAAFGLRELLNVQALLLKHGNKRYEIKSNMNEIPLTKLTCYSEDNMMNIFALTLLQLCILFQ